MSSGCFARLLAGHGERIAAQLRQAERDLAELTGRGQSYDRTATHRSLVVDARD
ncbi:MAG: hypothetical protein ABSA02_32080 [Trebonia sp.]